MSVTDGFPAAPLRNPAGHSPARRTGSIRRTSTLETTWPDGRDGLLQVVGRARDAVSPADGGPVVVCSQDEFRARLQWDRTITEIEATPARPKIAALVGARGGGHLRKALDDLLPEERRNATPLHLALDDISGVSLISGWAWSQWSEDFMRGPGGPGSPGGQMMQMDPAERMKRMEGVCHGFTPGFSALSLDRDFRSRQNPVPVIDLRRPDDPDGWHTFTPQDGEVAMRRARRIDVWREGGTIHMDAGFQDSATTPAGGRVAIHEYALKATADATSLKLLSVEADPRVLPFRECPAATNNLPKILGAPLPELREEVLKQFPRTAGCTHLNDALRALAEVPALLARLEAVP
jgi:hypothetical protein